MTEKNKYRDKMGRYTLDPGKRSRLVLEELYRAFDFFNDKFASGKLPKVIITIQESGRRNALGWYGKSFWSDSTCGEGVCEINISAEHLNRSAESILETLLHEMAHLKNSTENIRDCSSGQYHNKFFKQAAECFGLSVERSGTRGWSTTSLTEVSRNAIKDMNPNVDILTSLKRKTHKVERKRRYISLIISAEYETVLNESIEASGMSQREFVESSILAKVNELTPLVRS